MGSLFTSLQFKLWATIDNVDVDLVQFSCSYEMNTIPQCQLMLPVGYKVLPPHLPSLAHAVTRGIQVQIPLKVYCNVKYCGGQYQPTVPATGTYTMFEGYVTGVGYRRTYDGYSMVVEGTHWLSDLSYSSIMSENSNPQNPAHFTFNAAMLAEVGGAPGSCMPVTMVTVYTSDTNNVKTDLWGKVIQKWFLLLASKNRLNRLLLSNLDCNPNNDTKNNNVSKALQRIASEKLPFNTKPWDANVATVSAMIGKQLASVQQPTDAADALSRQTFWDKLIGEVAPTFMFSVVPFPTTAKVVPFIAGLRDFWDPAGEGFTFRSRDIQSQDTSCQLPRQLRGVCVAAGISLKGGAGLASSVANYRIGGAYIGSDTGMINIRNAPAFLIDSQLPHQFTGHVTQLRGNGPMHPGAGKAPPDPKPDDNIKSALNMMDYVAHCWYVDEVLKNRSGNIATTIRFDVAPGSSVRIEGTSGAFMANGESRYGQVTGVTHSFDAQQQQCGSKFRISNMHTEVEHQKDQFTTTLHPFYTTTWAGAKHITMG